MTEAVAFDTHRFVKQLKEGGFTETQAETLAEAQVALLNANLATKTDIAAIHADIARIEAGLETNLEALRLATKADIAAIHADIARIEAGLEANLEALRLATKADIADAKASLLKWMFSAMIAQGGLIVAVIVALIKLL